MAAFFHGPLWLWYMIFGLGVAGALIVFYNQWPTAVRAVAFVVSVIAWPIVLVLWVGYGLVFRGPR